LTPQTTQTKFSIQDKKPKEIVEKKNITKQDMIYAVREATAEKPPENEEEEYSPVKVSPDKIVSRVASINILEMLKGKSVEDLLEIEYLAVKHAPPGKDGLKKISEGRILKPIERSMFSLSEEESYEELNYLQSLSLQFQSLLYSEISKCLKPFNENNPAPFTIHNTEVSLIVDISSSMTTLNHSKLMGAQILSTGITSILSNFGILINMYCFADREAIWQLSDLSKSNSFLDLLRLVDALRIGERPGSYPLDALLTSQSEWETHRTAHSGAHQEVDYHFNIVISDFISAQVLDQTRDWSNENTGKCLLISFDTEFDVNTLDQKFIPRKLYENGLIPRISSNENIKSIRINPKDLYLQDSSKNNILSEDRKSVV
jgi:hypothetical protein